MREKEILSLIHLDICDPINVESVGVARYFLTFIDDYSRYMEFIMLRNKIRYRFLKIINVKSKI